MHKPTAKVWDVPSGLSAALAVTSICFFLGGCLGCLLAVRVGGGGNDLLAEYLTSFLQSVQVQPASPPLLISVWETIRWPLLVFGLGYPAGFFCAGIPPGLFHRLVRQDVRGERRAAGLRGLWRVRLYRASGAVRPGRTGLDRVPLSGHPHAGGRTAYPPVWETLFFALRGVCLRAVCVYLFRIRGRPLAAGGRGRTVSPLGNR